MCLGTGLLTTLKPSSSAVKWISFQVLAGIGAGSGGQLPLIAVQDALSRDDVSIGYAIVLSAGNMGPTAALAITQAVFGSLLTSGLGQKAPGVTPEMVKHAGATDWRQNVPVELVSVARGIYNHALARSWYVAMGSACVSFGSVLGMKWKRLDREDKKGHCDPAQSEKGPIVCEVEPEG